MTGPEPAPAPQWPGEPVRFIPEPAPGGVYFAGQQVDAEHDAPTTPIPVIDATATPQAVVEPRRRIVVYDPRTWRRGWQVGCATGAVVTAVALCVGGGLISGRITIGGKNNGITPTTSNSGQGAPGCDFATNPNDAARLYGGNPSDWRQISDGGTSAWTHSAGDPFRLNAHGCVAQAYIGNPDNSTICFTTSDTAKVQGATVWNEQGTQQNLEYAAQQQTQAAQIDHPGQVCLPKQ